MKRNLTIVARIEVKKATEGLVENFTVNEMTLL